MSDDIHYNKLGMKIVAKEIKKSLYSPGNRGNHQMSLLLDMAKPTARQTHPVTATIDLTRDDEVTQIADDVTQAAKDYEWLH